MDPFTIVAIGTLLGLDSSQIDAIWSELIDVPAADAPSTPSEARSAFFAAAARADIAIL